MSHDGSDGSKVWHRIARYGVAEGSMGENLSFGKSKGDEYILSLFIDDGVSNRGHRKAITSKKYHLAGVAYCPHYSNYAGMVSIAYATKFRLNRKGRKEIAKRYHSRRRGSNFPAEQSEIPPEQLNFGSGFQ